MIKAIHVTPEALEASEWLQRVTGLTAGQLRDIEAREAAQATRKAREASRKQRIAERRAKGPTGLLKALQVGDSLTLPQYTASSQVSAILAALEVRYGLRFTVKRNPAGLIFTRIL